MHRRLEFAASLRCYRGLLLRHTLRRPAGSTPRAANLGEFLPEIDHKFSSTEALSNALESAGDDDMKFPYFYPTTAAGKSSSYRDGYTSQGLLKDNISHLENRNVPAELIDVLCRPIPNSDEPDYGTKIVTYTSNKKLYLSILDHILLRETKAHYKEGNTVTANNITYAPGH